MKKRNLGNKIFLYLLAILVVGQFSAAFTSGIEIEASNENVGVERFENIRSKIIALIEKGKIPSMSIVVAKDGIVLWGEAFGWVDKDKTKKATLDTIYCVGSMSKSITATGMMVLVERGLVELDAPVDKYIAPSKLTVYEGCSEDVTIRHLLNGAAAIPHGWYSHHADEKLPILTPEEYIKRFGIVVFPPGEEFLYSNHAFGLAEHIIAKVSGQSYEEFMKANVFEPLGMIHSTQYINEELKLYAASPFVNMSYALPVEFMVGPTGGAGLYSSANDLLNYGLFNLKIRKPDQKQILSDETLDLMHYYNNEKIPQSWLTLGWGGGSMDFGEKTLLLSNGEVTGANATIALVPEDNVVVVCLANIAKNPSISDTFVFELLDELFPGSQASFNKAREDYSRKYFAEYEPQPRLFGEWIGEIRTPLGNKTVVMEFQEDGDIHIRMQNQLETLLTNLRFQYDMLLGSCNALIPGEEDEGFTSFNFFLRLKEDRIYGYYLANGTNHSEILNYDFPFARTGYIHMEKKH